LPLIVLAARFFSNHIWIYWDLLSFSGDDDLAEGHGFFSPLSCLKPGERWQARLKREDDHITIELSPFSPDRSRPSDGSEYYEVSFKMPDS